MRLRSRCLAIILLGVVYMPTAAAKVLSARVDDLGDLIQIVLMFERQTLIPLHPDRGFSRRSAARTASLPGVKGKRFAYTATPIGASRSDETFARYRIIVSTVRARC